MWAVDAKMRKVTCESSPPFQDTRAKCTAAALGFVVLAACGAKAGRMTTAMRNWGSGLWTPPAGEAVVYSPAVSLSCMEERDYDEPAVVVVSGHEVQADASELRVRMPNGETLSISHVCGQPPTTGD